MYCTQCGNKLRDGAKFCSECGNVVVAEVQSNDVEENVIVQQSSIEPTEIVEEIIIPEEKIESKASNKVILGIVFGTMVITFALIIGFSMI